MIPNPSDSGIEDLKIVAAKLKNHVGDISMNPLNNFLKMGIHYPYFQMWVNLQNEFGIKKD